MPKIVQFIHPGPEHSFDNYLNEKKHKDWNFNNHLRKFCKAKGKFIGSDNFNANGEFMFWSEWEPPSFVELTNQCTPLPNYIHFPYLPTDTNGNIIITGKQNTDPCVFGNYFKYFVCQQIKNGKLTQMARLDPGDLILFGSGKNKKFVIDTVFVVDTTIDISNIEPEYKDISINRIPNYSSLGCKIYIGKTFEKDRNIYSFTPASKNYFSRIEIPIGATLKLNKYITNTLTQGRKVSLVDQETVQSVWEELKTLTLNHGLVLAHKIEWPDKYCSSSVNTNMFSKC